MPDALIGHTGFVGGNLLCQRPFEALFNSKNIQEIRGKEYDVLVCSGAPAEKWKANKEPERDWEILQGLMGHLREVSARKVILISTVDVYPSPVEVDEDSLIDWEKAGAYGRHRRRLELFLQERFDTLVVRLPGLFGPGLKKNVVYDFLHDNRVEAINSEGVFQFYDLGNLWRDVQTALAHGLGVVNFTAEPVRVSELAREAFAREFHQPMPGPARYDLRSKHAALYGGRNGYFYDRGQVLRAMKAFVDSSRRQA
ncbi:NAD-dependent epimerase/dehydratase family protein [Hyalangium versicolor]|uniref:NAD-dependent epimerase/dehydratase family protein n=1 Tax=Hyalangium versicolor TaxID=2861190 RepID=UPI001CCBC122|nr:NAD(P)-dependent oxidoreductase [Hyalangium versicolor]